MAFATSPSAEDLARIRATNHNTPAPESQRANSGTGPSFGAGAVSWGAIAAGAAAAASLSLILLILGVGLGMSSVSPWARDGVSATTFGVSTIAWLTLTQLLASAVGGYLAGRLRTKWTGVQRDEVYFRDTAHGFLAWAISTLATAALLTSVIGSIVSGGMTATASLAAGTAATTAAAVAGTNVSPQTTNGGTMAYFIDALFRRATPAETSASAGTASASGTTTTPGATAQDMAEVGRIFMNLTRTEPLPAEDLRYVAQVVAERTGLSQAEAQTRVADVVAKAQAKLQNLEVSARETADSARKASAYSAIWLFVSLLLGAFVASLAATFGGRSRDA